MTDACSEPRLNLVMSDIYEIMKLPHLEYYNDPQDNNCSSISRALSNLLGMRNGSS